LNIKPQYLEILAAVGIDEATLTNSFSAATLKRGIEYFEQERVEIIDVDTENPRDIYISAEVMGSRGYFYDTEVEIKITRNYIAIIGECDCPVSFRCKHAVATLLALCNEIQDGTTTSEDDLKRTTKQDLDDLLLKYYPNARKKNGEH